MPELPEVETVRRQLIDHVVHTPIGNVTVNVPKLTNYDDNFSQILIGDEFTDIERIGKLLIFHLKNNADKKLLGHLKMTGQLIYADKNNHLVGGGHSLMASDLNLPHKHTHITITFTDGGSLYFNDMRRFGYLKFASNEDVTKIKSGYGIEPMTPNYTWDNFKKIFDKRTTTIKALLLNQKVISGLGNIYVDEACFRAKILPTRRANSLSIAEKKALFPACEDVMQESIDHGGTTFYNFVQTSGRKGNFSDYLLVFDRTGELCIDCDRVIEKIKCAGRGTHFCPQCQK